MVVSLSEPDFALLSKIIPPNSLNDLKLTPINKRLHIDGTIEQFELITEFIADELSNNGFDEHSEPNGHGIQLEKLIDAFSNVYQ